MHDKKISISTALAYKLPVMFQLFDKSSYLKYLTFSEEMIVNVIDADTMKKPNVDMSCVAVYELVELCECSLLVRGSSAGS